MKRSAERLLRDSYHHRFAVGHPVHEEARMVRNAYSEEVRLVRKAHWIEWLGQP
jgi:hypothetical protein